MQNLGYLNKIIKLLKGADTTNITKMANIFNIGLVVLVLLYCYSEVNASWIRRSRSRKRKPSPKLKMELFATRKLQKYGYFTSWVTNEASRRRAVKFFQMFNNLPVTGKVNNAVVLKLSKPRCGIRDPIIRKKEDFKEYYLAGSIWKNRTITWHWNGNKTDYREMSKDDTFNVLRQAFDMWASACNNLVFIEKRHKRVDIEINFVRASHRGPFRGDGHGESIGHAFYPYLNKGFAGDIHFDDAEEFTMKSTSKTTAINFLWAAAHEIGHSLGLEHSHDPNSIMYPWYNKTSPILRLHHNDINGITSLYPPKDCTKETVTNTTKLVPTETTKKLFSTSTTKLVVPTNETMVSANEPYNLTRVIPKEV